MGTSAIIIRIVCGLAAAFLVSRIVKPAPGRLEQALAIATLAALALGAQAGEWAVSTLFRSGKPILLSEFSAPELAAIGAVSAAIGALAYVAGCWLIFRQPLKR